MADLVDALICMKLNDPYELKKVRLGDLRDDEILIQMKATGVCHADLACTTGKLPNPLPLCGGHEGAGIVERVGSAIRHVEVGDHVLLSYKVCGECIACKKGAGPYCTKFAAENFRCSRSDGTTSLSLENGQKISSHFFGQSSFSQRAIVSGQVAVKIDKDLPFDTLCSLGCGIQTGAGTVLNVLKPKLGANILIFGVGSVGMAAVMAAKLTPCAKIIAVDIHDSKLELARQLGATHTINSTRKNALEEIMNLTDGFGVDCALDATGRLEVIKTMFDCAAPGSIVATVGSPGAGKKLDIEPHTWIEKAVSYVGVCEGSAVPSTFIPLLIEFWRSGRFPLEKLVTTYPYTEFEKAKEDTETGKCVKAVLLWNQHAQHQQ
ncbi:aryl-alcohol dehydrogenase [Xylogone sp. PMI_703]|nr:aryl-alcohol dehydrogenase [Xylogone sp. PMI_703]